MKKLLPFIVISALLASFVLFGVGSLGNILVAQEGVGIGGEVLDEDSIRLLSTVDVNPTVLPVGGTALVTVTVRDTGGVVRPGEMIRLEVTGPSGVTLNQPTSLTDENGQTFGAISSPIAGLVTVRAFITTYPIEIPIQDTGTALFEPVGVPILQAEPQFTQGETNTVSWTGNPLLDDFQVMIARDVGFTQGVILTPWLSETDFTFADLLDGQIYYYRVRARNKYDIVSDWSNVVYSIQDVSSPWSSVADVDVQENGFALQINAGDAVSGVDFIRIFAQRNGADWSEVKTTNNFNVVVTFEEIVGSNPLLWDGVFCFYVQAVDNVGNEEAYDPGEDGDVCIDSGEPPVPPEKPPIERLPITVIVDDTRTFLEYLWEEAEDFVRIERERLISLLVMIPIAASIGMLLLAFRLSLRGFPILIVILVSDLLSLLGITKKRIRWGVVYDSVTKEPQSRSEVRLFSARTLVRTIITDVHGTLSFELKKGLYTISVQKSGYIFPSKIVTSLVDGIRKNIYRGEEFPVKSDDQEVDLNIPIDPIEISGSQRVKVLVKSILSFVIALMVPLILLIGAMTSIVCYVTLGESVYLILIAVNSLLLVLHLSIEIRRKPCRGKVVDQKGKAMSNIRIGLFDRKYRKLVDERVTDERGTYRFIVQGGEYLILPLSKGYVIAKEGFSDGYLVGKKSDSDIIVADRIELRYVPSSPQSGRSGGRQ